MDIKPEWVPVKDVAVHYCVSRETIRVWMRDGVVRWRRAPSGRPRMYIGDVESPTCRKRLERRKQKRRERAAAEAAAKAEAEQGRDGV